MPQVYFKGRLDRYVAISFVMFSLRSFMYFDEISSHKGWKKNRASFTHKNVLFKTTLLPYSSRQHLGMPFKVIDFTETKIIIPKIYQVELKQNKLRHTIGSYYFQESLQMSCHHVHNFAITITNQRMKYFYSSGDQSIQACISFSRQKEKAKLKRPLTMLQSPLENCLQVSYYTSLNFN